MSAKSAVLMSCFLIALVEGFDSQIMALATPQIAAAWGRPAHAFALVFSATAVGTAFGAPLLGAAADRLGRKWVLVASMLALGALTVLIAAATSIQAVAWLRLLSGFCLGGSLAGVIALAGDISRPEHRVRDTMLIYTGAPFGAMTGSLAGGYLLAFGDWRLIFYSGGALALLSAVLPMAFVRDTKPTPKPIRRDDPAPAAKSSLMSRRFLPRTVLLCAAEVVSLTAATLLTSWLPTVVARATGSVAQASLFNSLIYVGAIGGAFGMAPFVARIGAARLLAWVFSAAAVIAILAHFGLSAPGAILVLSLLALGFGFYGGQMTLHTLGAGLYPAELRGVGIGLALGVGRIGALLGPVVGGALLASPALRNTLFLVLSGIIAATAVAVMMLAHVTRHDPPEASPAT